MLRGKSNIQKLEDRALSGKDRNEKGGKAGAGGGGGNGRESGGNAHQGRDVMFNKQLMIFTPPKFTCRIFKLFSYILYFSLGLSTFFLENANGSESLQQGGWLAGRQRQRQNSAPGQGTTKGTEGREAPVGSRH